MKAQYCTTADLSNLLDGLYDMRPSKKVLIGFDGYIDSLYKVVKTQSQDGEPVYYRTIDEYGQHICRAAGRSADISMVRIAEQPGGNAPLMADGMGALGDTPVLLGALGYPEMDPSFESLHAGVKKISYANPCKTIAQEFDDGKLMLGDLSHSKSVNWNEVQKVLEQEKMESCLDEADLVAVLNWSAHVGVSGIAQNVSKRLQKDGILFYDIADPASVPEERFEEIFDVIACTGKDHPTVLGLNENEARNVFKRLLHLEIDNLDTRELVEQWGMLLLSKLNLCVLTIHTHTNAFGVNTQGIWQTDILPVEKARFATGAGDHYNAAFCYAYLGKKPLVQCLAFACAAASHYVKYGKSATLQDVERYLKEQKSLVE